MSDEEVVNWIWNDPKGVVHSLFSVVDLHFPKESLLHKLLSNTRATYPVLSAFTEFSQITMHQSVESKKGKNACTRDDARRLVREALLEFRSDINDFLSFAETSYFDAIKKKKKEAERRRNADKNAKKLAKSKQNSDESDNGGEETVCSVVVTASDAKGGDSPIPQNVTESQTCEEPETTGEMSVDGSHVSDDVIRIRGGGEHILCSESNPPVGLSSGSGQAAGDNSSPTMLQNELPMPNDHLTTSQN
jgi:RNase P protein component